MYRAPSQTAPVRTLVRMTHWLIALGTIGPQSALNLAYRFFAGFDNACSCRAYSGTNDLVQGRDWGHVQAGPYQKHPLSCLASAIGSAFSIQLLGHDANVTDVMGSRSPVRPALSRDRQQLIEKMESADSIVLLYDVTRPETLMRLDTFWLPLMERNAQA